MPARLSRKALPCGFYRPPPRTKRWKGPAPIILLDQTPFLKAAVAACKRAVAKVRRCRAEIAAFEAEDQPAFEQWRAVELGPEMTRLRELAASIEEKRQLFAEMREAMNHRGVPEERVYDYVMRHRADPAYRDPRYDRETEPSDSAAADEHNKEGPWDDDPDDKEDPWEDEDADDGGDEWEEAFGRFFDDLFGRNPNGRNGTGDRSNRAELKHCYRRLARLLHPDAGGSRTPLAREHWNAANEAYERGDVDTLRALLSVCEAEHAVIGMELGLARLEEIRRHHDFHYGELAHMRAKLRYHEAWGFAKMKPADRVPVARNLRWGIEEEIDDLRAQLAQMEEVLEDLAKLSRRAREADERRIREAAFHRAAFGETKGAEPGGPLNGSLNGRPARRKSRAPDPAQSEFAF